MDFYQIDGGVPLCGEYRVKGAKNAALPIMAACICCPGVHRLQDCPRIGDVYAMQSILHHLGVRTEWEDDALVVSSQTLRQTEVPKSMMEAMRSSVFLLGSLLARCGEAKIHQPGGCRIGSRPIDMHLDGLRQLGFSVEEADGAVTCRGTCRGGEITLPYPSVGATENLMMAAVAAKGVTVITGAPEKSAQEILRRVGPTSGVICFEEFADLFREQEVHTLGPVGDKLVQAQRVFDALRTFDTSDVTEIFAQCPDNRGLGLAIGNRLKKAAGFHVVEADSERVVLGLTGGTGAGKSSALRAIRSLGGEVIDCDALYHEMLETCAPLRDEIGVSFPGAFDAAGQLDRRKLGQEVFSHKDRLEQLNGIVARHLVPEVRRRLAASESKIFAIDAINLLEGGLDQLCDRTIAVTAPLELRVRRIMARDNITEQYARLRISAQQPDEYYRGKCDCELNNAADTAAAFEMEAREFFQRLIDTIKEEKAHGKQGI